MNEAGSELVPEPRDFIEPATRRNDRFEHVARASFESCREIQLSFAREERCAAEPLQVDAQRIVRSR